MKAKGFPCISVFTMDDACKEGLEALKQVGVRFIAVRAAGYDNIDIKAAKALGIRVANVPGYSPYAIAELALSLLLALNRKTIKAYQQVQSHNFTIDNLIGYDLNGKKAGVIGTGKIGSAMIKILHGLGCTILANDVYQNRLLEHTYNVHYVDLDTLCCAADIITIHTPLNKNTHHLINKTRLQKMKKGVTIINTSRGAIIETEALVAALESGLVGAAGLDVYEYEKGIFFQNLSATCITDPLLLKLLGMDNVLITPHQGFATTEALINIALTTCSNITCWEQGQECPNEITQ